MKSHLCQIACVLTLCGFVGAGGCAGKPPTEQVANTEKMIGQAGSANATVYAPLELKLAGDKLQAAKAAVDKKEYDQALRLLEEAQADADLANAKSASAKARQTAKEMRDSIDALRQETQRTQKAQ